MANQETKKTPTRKKDTPGLLMSIIRTLSIGADVHQRQQEKARLEKAYKECDHKLNSLVQEHMTDLTSIMQAFSTISTRITTSQERIRAIKDNLQSCKNLLHCKRDELRKLWIEGIQHKTIVAMLDQIEQVKDVGGKLQGYIDKKQYLHATQLFVSSFALLEGDLSEVEALRDVKAELISKKEELCELLVEELHRQMYIKSTSGVVKGFQRHGSLRSSTRGDSMAVVTATAPQQSTQADLLAEQNLKRLTTVNLDRLVAPRHITEDLDTDPEMDVVHFIAVLVESLAMLKKLPEAIESLLSHIRPGLLAIVQRSSQQVADNAYLEGENITQLYQPHFLLELLELIFEQFRIVARTHQVVLANMQRVKNTNPAMADVELYDTVEVWVKIQAVLQLLLSDYLDIRNTATAEGRSRPSFDEPSTEVAAYFTRKTKTKPKKFALFRFDASSHAISMSSYMREQRQEFYGLFEAVSDAVLQQGEALGDTENTTEVGKAQFVCKPTITNITTIYNALQKFMGEIETATDTSPGTCTLQGFVTEFIENIYLGHVMYSIQSNIDITTKGFDSQRAIIDLRTQRELMLAKPLLQSTVSVVRNIGELQNLMRDLPDYADQFLNMICKILQDYKDTCQASYKGIVQSETDDRRIISATWAKDEDINRFLRCLPNWRNLKEDTVIEEQMSEEDLRAMNSKESAILTSNLSAETLICEQEIITDVLQLRTLANLCESLEWFAGHISSLADQLGAAKQQKSQFVHPGGSMVKIQQPLPPVSEKTLKVVRSLAEDFQAESEVCLIVLHLEVRVHCFFHLIPLAKQQSNYCNAIDDMDPDFNVIKLNKDLANIEDTLQQSLQMKRFKYVFEGLGHLVSTILINCTLFLKRINENGIKKMCRNIFSVQQSLTNITMSREADLDHARQYYELLYLTADEILKALVARGPQFSEQEYANLLGLAYRSERGASDINLSQLCKRLEEILSEYDSIV